MSFKQSHDHASPRSEQFLPSPVGSQVSDFSSFPFIFVKEQHRDVNSS